MKRFLGILAGLLVLNGCDDGDLAFETINFDDVAIQQPCGNILYKLNNTEALILEIPASVNAFPEEPTLAGIPSSIEINATNRVVYRLYNGAVTRNNICETIQPAMPIVLEEWTAISGFIQTTTTPVIIPNTTIGFEGGEKITRYQHNIVFTNILFQKGDGTTQLYNTFPFGIFTKDKANTLPFNFADIALNKCSSGDLVYKFVGREALTLNLDPALLNNTVLNQVKSGLLTTTTNKLTYGFFGPITSALNASYFCSATPPANPLEIWNGVDGVTNTSGIVEVVTTTNGSGFLHTIRLKKATLKKGNSSFLLADDYLFGELITN